MEKRKKSSHFILKTIGLSAFFYIAYNGLKSVLRTTSVKNKVIFISGGSRGLGFVMAKKLAREGALLSLLARDEKELLRAQNMIQFEVPGAQVIYNVGDATNPAVARTAIANTYQHFKRLDVVINNAGVISIMPLENASEKEFQASIDTHFWAPYHITEAALPIFRAQGTGRIVNISSIGGKMAVPHLAPYCAGKFALVGYSKSLRAELLKENIFVTTVCPGLMRTGSAAEADIRGQHEKEYAWFSIADSLPVLSMSAETAAEQIIGALKQGRAELTISLPAKLALAFQAAFPELHADLLSLANRMLPAATPQTFTKKGKDSHSAYSPSALTVLSDRAAIDNNGEPHP